MRVLCRQTQDTHKLKQWDVLVDGCNPGTNPFFKLNSHPSPRSIYRVFRILKTRLHSKEFSNLARLPNLKNLLSTFHSIACTFRFFGSVSKLPESLLLFCRLSKLQQSFSYDPLQKFCKFRKFFHFLHIFQSRPTNPPLLRNGLQR